MEAPETVGVVIGNHTQKYTARNPAIRLLTERWVANLDRVLAQVEREPVARWVGPWRSAAARG